MKQETLMKSYMLRLYEDVLPANLAPVYLPLMQRAVYVVEGDVTIELPTGCQHHAAGTAWLGEDQIAFVAGQKGARLWRWELVANGDSGSGLLRTAPGTTSQCKLNAEIELNPEFDWLMRCDQVGFPKGGIAYTHVHQGPGVRCCLSGEIGIETGDKKNRYRPGEAWLERGVDPIYAPTTEASETEFIRCLILPRSCKGRSSIRYVLEEDAKRPKLQRYHVFGERFFDLKTVG
jgi:hypothetical protein